MPLSLEKSGVIHCGKNQPNYNYIVHGNRLPVIESMVELGVIRSANGGYDGQCAAVRAKANKISGAIRRVFQLRDPRLLWPAFCSYVLPVLNYCSSAWSPSLIKNIKHIEQVQRRFTKSMPNMRDLTYEERLTKLGALSPADRRMYNDMVLTFKALHGLINCTAEDLGLTVMQTITRGGGIRLVQRVPISRTTAALFSLRVPTAWNKLPLTITSCRSLAGFKHQLMKHLHNNSVLPSSCT